MPALFRKPRGGWREEKTIQQAAAIPRQTLLGISRKFGRNTGVQFNSKKIAPKMAPKIASIFTVNKREIL